jgi:hypothetical protein
MRNLIIIALVVATGCAKGTPRTDSAPPRDSVVATPRDSLPAASSQKNAPSVASTVRPAPVKGPPVIGRMDFPAESLRAAPAASDSVRGIVSVVGTSFEKKVMVAVAGTQRRVEIAGPIARLVGHLAGAELSVAGTLSGTRLDATGFVVRSVDGLPAIDGTLKTEGGAMYIVTANGSRTRFLAPPPPFVGHEGARVWVTGDPTKGVQSFGFIDPPV